MPAPAASGSSTAGSEAEAENSPFEIDFHPDGSAGCLYGEAVDLHVLGRLQCTRASHVEFNADTQNWEVRLPGGRSPVFTDPLRSACLAWERRHLAAGPGPAA